MELCLSRSSQNGTILSVRFYAPVICIPRALWAGITRYIAELKCGDLTYNVSPECHGFAEV